jgi:DNA-binding HxlR family transcriptional regulator
MVCSVANVLAAVNDRWGFLILRDLVLGLRRYDDFRRSSGVTNTTLSDRLRHLEANGLVERRRYQTRPDRFEYFLTPKGEKIGAVMAVLAQIGDDLASPDTFAPPMRFINRNTGAEVTWGYIDQTTGKRVSHRDMAIEPGPGADELMRWRLSHAGQAPSAPNPAILE